MKKILLLTLLICQSVAILAADNWIKVENLWYWYNDAKTDANVVAAREGDYYASTLTGAITIPKTITVDETVIPVSEIRKDVFINCTGITSVVIDADLTVIKSSCFQGCTALQSINIPATVTEIETNAFKNCTHLAKVDIPDGMTTIKGSAFYNCSGMTELNIPASITTIEGDVFYGCSSLTKVNFASIENLCAIIFLDFFSNPLNNVSSKLYIGGTKVEETLIIPASVTTINKFAFAGLKSVNAIDFSEVSTALDIKEDAFYYINNCSKLIFRDAEQLCSMQYEDVSSNPLHTAHHIYFKDKDTEETEVTIPATSLDGNKVRPYIFAGAYSLTRINFPEEAKIIGKGALRYCGSLKYVNFTSEAHFIEVSWEDNDANPFVANKNVEPLANNAPLENITLTKPVPNGKYKYSLWLKTVTLQSGVTSIGAEAFLGCTNLKSLTFENGGAVTTIGEKAFHSCENLNNIKLPETLTAIGMEAFRNCKKFTEITIPANCTTLGTGAFAYCTQLKTATIESGADISKLCFQKCGNLTEVITTTTKDIKDNAFEGCSSLKAIPLTNNLTTIGDNAFIDCTSLTCLVLTEKGALAEIGLGAFKGCNKLTMVRLPATIEKIQDNAFDGCTSMRDVFCLKDGNVPLIYSNTFGGRESSMNLHVTNTGLYKYANNWNKFPYPDAIKNVTLTFYINDIEVGHITEESGKTLDKSKIPTVSRTENETTQEIFSDWDKAIPETMPSSDTNFYGYISTKTTIDHLKYFLHPAEILNGKELVARAEVIGVEDGFITPNANNNVTINETVSYNDEPYAIIAISDNAFEGQKELKSITLTTNIKTIGTAAFKNCGKLATVDGLAQSKVTVLNDYVFQNCTSLSLTIPSTIKTLGYKALSNIGNVEITVPASVIDMSDEVFVGCKSLQTVKFADEFSLDLPKLTFYNCNALTNITLSSNMKVIGIRAFEGCSALAVIVLPEGIKTIGTQAFKNSSKLANITLPTTLSRINEQAFTGCSSLAQIVANGATPPVTYENAFDTPTYNTAKVYVNGEGESLANYQADQTWKKFGDKLLSNQTFKLTYMVDGTLYKEYDVLGGSTITAEAEPTNNDGREFSGWQGLPDVMPAENTTVAGNFKYEIKFYENEEDESNRLFKSNDYKFFFGDKIELPLEDLPRAGHKYTLQGLSTDPIPEDDAASVDMNMPANDINVIVTYQKAEAEFANNNITYKVYMLENRAEVVSGAPESGKTTVTIPATVEYQSKNYPVTVIQANAFRGNTKLTAVTINNSVKVIGDNAFQGCKLLATISMPTTLDSIGQQAFSNTAITSVTVPHAPKMGKEIFYWCTKLKRIDGFSSGLTTIPERMFQNCTELDDIIIPAQITKIGDHAFDGCSSIAELTLPTTVQTLGSGAFYGVFGKDDILTIEGNSLPSASDDTFDQTAYDYVLLKTSVNTTEAGNPWKLFANVEGSETEQCAKPTISYRDGKIIFHTDTQGATIVSTIKILDTGEHNVEEVTVTKYEISAYAKKNGMRRSEPVTRIVQNGDVNLDGAITAQDASLILQRVAGKIATLAPQLDMDFDFEDDAEINTDTVTDSESEADSLDPQ